MKLYPKNWGRGFCSVYDNESPSIGPNQVTDSLQARNIVFLDNRWRSASPTPVRAVEIKFRPRSANQLNQHRKRVTL
jgi:hypothetical protein